MVGLKNTNPYLRGLVVFSYLAMVFINILANNMAINGITTGRVSEAYPNLFAPAGITFAIWGLIYALLFVFVIYYLGIIKNTDRILDSEILNKIGWLFSISSIANGLWIFSWHYDYIALSMIIMIIILTCLVLINNITCRHEIMTRKEEILIKIPFSIYFGWITVATIANATVLLVSFGWQRFGIPEELWTIVVLAIGMMIGTGNMLRNRDIAYGLILIWAYYGIYLKHTSQAGYNGEYQSIINSIIICIVIYVVAAFYILMEKRKFKINKIML